MGDSAFPKPEGASTGSFSRNVSVTVIANAIIAAASLVSGPMAARLLGPSGRGELAAVQNLYWVVAILGMAGLPEATLYFSARQKSSVATILANSVAVCTALAPLIIAVFYFAAPYFLARQSGDVLRCARICLFFIPVFAWSSLPLFAMRGAGRFDSWNALRILPGLFWVIALCILYIRSQHSAIMAAYAYVVAIGATTIPTILICLRHFGRPHGFDRTLISPMLRYGAPLAAASVPQLLNARVDQLIIAAILPASYLGTYAVAAAWSTSVSPILLAIATMVFPRVAAASEEHKSVLFMQGTRFATLVAIALGLAVTSITPMAVPMLFGKAFLASVVPSLILLWGALLGGINIVLEEGLRGVGDTKAILMGEFFGCAITALGVLIALHVCGLWGAAMASVIGYGVSFAILVYRACHALKITVRSLLIPSRRDLTMYKAAARRIGSSVAVRVKLA